MVTFTFTLKETMTIVANGPTSRMRVTSRHTICFTDTTQTLPRNYLPTQRKPSAFLPNNLQNDPVFV